MWKDSPQLDAAQSATKETVLSCDSVALNGGALVPDRPVSAYFRCSGLLLSPALIHPLHEPDLHLFVPGLGANDLNPSGYFARGHYFTCSPWST